MFKKISAVVLALVLCLSVMVLPTYAGFDSSYELPAGKDIAYKIELDKDKYAAGDIATIKVYFYVNPEKELGTGALVFGMNSAVFSMADNPIDDVKSSSTGNETFNSFYETPPKAVWAWQTNATVLSRLKDKNTEEENARYDQYIKIIVAREISGSHENAFKNKNGLPATDINADKDPFITFQLKVRDDFDPSTQVCVGIPTGAMPNRYTYMNWYSELGISNKVIKTTLDTTDLSAIYTIANLPVSEPVVALNKKQVKFVSDGMGGVEKDYKFRVKSVVSEADWNAFFANTNVAGETTNLVENVGIVAYKGTADWDADTAKAVVAGTPATGYTAAETDYIQKIDGDNAYFGAIIELNSDTCGYDITFMGYVKYKDADGVSQIIFYDAEATAAVHSKYTVNVNQWISENA